MNKRRFLIPIFLITALFAVLPRVSAENNSENIIYVSPEGDDRNDGSLNKPLKTLEGAKRAVRTNSAFRKEPIRVVFEGGTYYMDSGVSFTHYDSTVKNAPVTYEAKEGEKVVFSGGKTIDTSKFTLVTDEEILKLLPEHSRGKVYQTELSRDEYGEIAPFDAYKYYTSGSGKGAYTSLFVNGQEQMDSQWPNGKFNYSTFGTVLKAGVERANNSSAKGLENAPLFKFDEINPKKWTNAKYARFAGFPSYTYAYEEANIHEVNAEENTIQLREPLWYRMRGSSMRRWKVFNLIEEMDVPTEWYLDVETNILYYYPTENFFEENPLMEITILNEKLLSFKDVKNLEFKGIEFTKSRDYLVSIGTGCDVTMRNCTFTNGESKGLYINSAPKVYDCKFMHIDLNGLVYYYDEGELSGKGEIINNYFYDVGIRGGNTPHAIQSFAGSNCLVKGNTIHCLPGGAYVGGLVESEMSYNEIYNFVQQFSDMGAFYNGQVKTNVGKVIKNNFIYDYKTKSSHLAQKEGILIQGVYMDDANNYSVIKDNIFYDGTYAAMMIGGGQYHFIENNIILKMEQTPISTDNRTETWQKQYNGNYLGEGLKTAGSYMNLLKYPYVVNVPYDPLPPYGNRIVNNIADDKFTFNERVEELGTIKDNITVEDYSCFENPDKLDFRLKEDSELGKRFPQLTKAQFDLNDVGCDLYVTEDIDRNFELISPVNNEKDFDYNENILIWTCANMADKYHVTIAKDPEFKDIVYDDEVTYNWLKLDNLENGGVKYYWKVKAINTSFKRMSEWESQSGVFSFETSDGRRYYLSLSEKVLNDIKNQFISVINRELYDSFKLESLEKEMEKCQKILENRDKYTVEEIIKQYNDLNDAFLMAKESRIVKFTKLDEKYFKDKAYWLPEDSGFSLTENGIIYKSGDSKTSAMTLKELQGESDIIQFRARIDYKDTAKTAFPSFELRRNNITKPVWSDKGYMFAVKKDLFEAQIYPSGEPMVGTLENNVTTENEWHEYAIGAINYLDYVRFICIIDGKVIFDYKDYRKTVPDNNYFNIYTAGLESIEIAPSELELDLESLQRSTEYPVTSSSYSEKGMWEQATETGYNGKIVRKSGSDTSVATWKIKPGEGMKEINFWKNVVDDGDRSAKLTVTYDYDKAGEGEEETKVYNIDFTSGESGWQKLDINDVKKGEITVTLSGSGNGAMYTNAIQCVEVRE